MKPTFETTSDRVLGIAFHPVQPWVLASLATGVIQLWDSSRQKDPLLEVFDEHEGPVQGLDFHPEEAVFVSGGFDRSIKIWDYRKKSSRFTLSGHKLGVNTTFFHKGNPWIVSASIDNTIRIWNWKFQKCIAVLTGHVYSVIYAQFHPRKSLVVSTSVDCTIRVWDLKDLETCTLACSIFGPEQFEPGMRELEEINEALATERILTTATVVRHGDTHRFANYVAFNPLELFIPTIVSGAGDHLVKVWNRNEVQKEYQNESMVTCCVVHPNRNLVVSCSKDKAIVWDLEERVGHRTFHGDYGKFMAIMAHPTQNLFAVGHQFGMVVFKLKWRPAYTVCNNMLHYVKNERLRRLDFETMEDVDIMRLENCGRAAPSHMSFNPDENAVLISTRSASTDSSVYDLYYISKNTDPPSQDNGLTAMWIDKNYFAVLQRLSGSDQNSIVIKSLTNQLSLLLEVEKAEEIYPAGTGKLLVRRLDSLLLYQCSLVSYSLVGQVKLAKCRHVVWSSDMSRVALIAKHTITICNSNLETLRSIDENLKLKSAAWDDSGIFFYSTSEEIKYCFPNGDLGTIRTIELPIYLTRIRGMSVYYLDRDCNPQSCQIESTEYESKLALFNCQIEAAFKATEVLEDEACWRGLAEMDLRLFKGEGSGWKADEDHELPADLQVSAAAETEEGFFAAPTCNSQLAVEHMLAASFESAFDLLHEQIGVVKFEPIKDLFLSTLSSKGSFPTLPSTGSLVASPQRKGSTLAPALGIKLNDLEQKLRLCCDLTTSGEFAKAIEEFRVLLLSIPLLVVENQQEIAQAQELLRICREYVLGLTMENHRKKMPKDTAEELRRNCELAAYLTHFDLQPIHQIPALRTASNLFFELKNYKTAEGFARKLLLLGPDHEVVDEMGKLLQACEKTPVDEFKLNYDEFKPFAVCGASYTPIYRGEIEVKCPFCAVSYCPQFNRIVCQVCTVAEVGKDTIGLRISSIQFH